jgi:hypothetical protein
VLLLLVPAVIWAAREKAQPLGLDGLIVGLGLGTAGLLELPNARCAAENVSGRTTSPSAIRPTSRRIWSRRWCSSSSAVVCRRPGWLGDGWPGSDPSSWRSAGATPSGSGNRVPRIHTSCAVVVAPTLDRAFARWCFTVECDRPRRWAAAFSDPAGGAREPVWIGPARRHAPKGAGGGPRWLFGRLGHAFGFGADAGRGSTRTVRFAQGRFRGSAWGRRQGRCGRGPRRSCRAALRRGTARPRGRGSR